jgi:hypothetical protein
MGSKQFITYLIVFCLFSSVVILMIKSSNKKEKLLKNKQKIYQSSWPIGNLENKTNQNYKDFFGLNSNLPEPKNNTPYIRIPDAITSLLPVSIPDNEWNSYLTESYLNGNKLATFKKGEVKFGDLDLTDKPNCNWIKVGYLSSEKTFLDEDKQIFILYRKDTDKKNEFIFKAVLLNGAEILLPSEINFVRNSEILPAMKGTEYEWLGRMKVSLDRPYQYNFTW